MNAPSTSATHANPVWRHRTNYIVQLDLTGHGLAGRFEQMWTRTDDKVAFELCCIPLFAYGMSLGDWLRVDLTTGRHEVIRKSGRKTLRVAFLDEAAAHDRHAWLHDVLIVQAKCLVEFQSPHYLAVDLADEDVAKAVPDLLNPLHREGVLTWEWADPTPES